jgi:hypothetical protein
LPVTQTKPFCVTVAPVGLLRLMSTRTDQLSICEIRPSDNARMIVHPSLVQICDLKSSESLFVIALCFTVKPLLPFVSRRKMPQPAQRIEFGSVGFTVMQVPRAFDGFAVFVPPTSLWLLARPPVMTSK